MTELVSEKEKGKFQILCLSGGGVRGLYTISVLAELEDKLSRDRGIHDYNIVRHFDMVAGTSIGGILALALTAGKNARSLQKLLDDKRKEIFPHKKRRWFSQAKGVAFDAEVLSKIIEQEIGSIRLKDLKTRVIVPAVNGSKGLPKVFKTPHHKDFTWDGERKVIDVALATSAAPTYFKAHSFSDANMGLMLDGGLFANSPSFIAYHEATCSRFLNIDSSSVYMLKVGTMGTNPKMSVDSTGTEGYLKGWGFGRGLLEMVMGVSETWHNSITGHYLEDRFVSLDDENIHDFDLADSSDITANALKLHANDRAQYASGNQNIMAFFEHEAEKPKFYNGGK